MEVYNDGNMELRLSVNMSCSIAWQATFSHFVISHYLERKLIAGLSQTISEKIYSYSVKLQILWFFCKNHIDNLNDHEQFWTILSVVCNFRLANVCV